MATPTLASLLTTITQSQAFAALLNYYTAAGFPTTTWQAGDIDLTRMQAFAAALQAYVTNYLPAVAGGTLLDYSPSYPGWTALTAQQIYNLPQNIATYTQGGMTATNTATAPYAFTAGQLYAVFGASGNRYINTGSGTIPASGALTGIPFQAESPGAAYADPSSSPGTLTLVTPLPGVTMSNPASLFSNGGVTVHVGSGTGAITLSGTPVGNHSITVSVAATSVGAPASLAYVLDGGTSVSLGIGSAFTNVAGLGIILTLTNGASGTSWVSGDTYSFSTPGSWLSSQGANIETDIALAARCRNRWGSLSVIPTTSAYQLWATSTPVVGSQVTQCFVVPDPIISGQVNIVVAGPSGVLPAPAIALIQAYIAPRVPITENPVVLSPTTLAVTIGGVVTVLASQLTSALNAITTALNNYVGGVGVNGTIRVSVIVEAVMLIPGVIDITGATINGAATNLTLGGPGSYVLPAYPPTLALGSQTQ